jgi:type I restriction enzyme R subunit
MTGSAADEEKIQKHVGGKQRRDLLAKRMKDNNDELKLVIVRDMWLTGFDVPSMHTMYVDKPMRGHNLMQAIARVNRVFKEKSGGVVVDYIGILESLKDALNQYTNKDRKNTGIDTSVAVNIMLEKLEILNNMMHGYNYTDFMGASQLKRARSIAGGMNHILGKSEEDQKEFKKITLELAKAHALCAATEEGRNKNLEVSYFKAVKASLVKLEDRKSPVLSKAEIDARINQMLQRSIISEEVIDVFDALKLEKPEISILSEDFLNEIRHMDHKNLAVEMLRKLLEGKIKTIERTNLVKSEKFSEMLTRALNKYRNQSLTNVEVLEELIRMAHEIKASQDEEKKLGLSEDEIAFYYALTADDLVKQLMEDEILKKIARELTEAIRRNTTVDWNIRKSARANIRRVIKRLLKKYDYPPDKRIQAMTVVMRQAEKMAGNFYDEVESTYGWVAEEEQTEY